MVCRKNKNNLKEESEENAISEKQKSKKWFDFWK